jgi:sigma-54 dependent transcriptional regulator, acetoin dehydrogenase operon transcriptional activator AcoR
VEEARGNVMEAARALGISRATVYRKLTRKKPAA